MLRSCPWSALPPMFSIYQRWKLASDTRTLSMVPSTRLSVLVSCPSLPPALVDLAPLPFGFLASLAQLELASHDQWLISQGLDPLMDPSARAQYSQLCFRQSSARLGHTIAKATVTVMRLLAMPSLPASAFPSRACLAWNRPCPADSLTSFSPSIPLSNSPVSSRSISFSSSPTSLHPSSVVPSLS